MCGFLITTAQPQSGVPRSLYKAIIPESRYKGVAYGVPWPLELVDEKDLTAAEWSLIKKVWEPLTARGLPEIIDDIALVKRFFAACEARGIACRFLFCCVPDSQPSPPELSRLRQAADFLGYDCAYPSCDYSALSDDFYPAPHPSFSFYKEKLNENGLFDSESDARDYLAFRDRYVVTRRDELGLPADGSVGLPDLEDSGPWFVLAVHEIGSLEGLESSQSTGIAR